MDLFQSPSETSSTISSFSENDDVIEEMTQEEFNMMNAKLLLRDPVLWNIFDTTLRISVGNDFYKITRYGTFITSMGNEEELYDVIRDFEQIKKTMADTDSLVSITPNVQYINSFKYTDLDNIVSDTDMENSQNVSTRAISNDWISEYGLNTHKWEARGCLQGLWSTLTGNNFARENYFSSDRRVKFNRFYYEKS